MKKIIKKVTKKVKPVEKEVLCVQCKGTGRHLPEQTCPTCNGTGK